MANNNTTRTKYDQKAITAISEEFGMSKRWIRKALNPNDLKTESAETIRKKYKEIVKKIDAAAAAAVKL